MELKNIEHKCLFCCSQWDRGKCGDKCKHEKGKICERQKEGLKLPLSKDELKNGWEWEGFLGGSAYNTYALALLCAEKIKRRYSKVEIIKIKDNFFKNSFLWKIRYMKGGF